MPTIRVLRLCELRRTEVHQPVRLHHPQLSHPKRPRRRARSMFACTSFDSCIRIPSSPVGYNPFDDEYESFCGYPLIKPRLKGNLSGGVKQPSKQANLAFVGNHRNPFDDDYEEYAGDHQSQSLKARLDSATLFGEDDYIFDYKVPNSGLLAKHNPEHKVSNPDGMAMHVHDNKGPASDVVPHSNELAMGMHGYKTPSSKAKHKPDLRSPNFNVYTTSMHDADYDKNLLNSDGSAVYMHDYKMPSSNVLAKQKPGQKPLTSNGLAMRMHDHKAPANSDHKLSILHALPSPKRRASRLYEHVFRHKPNPRVAGSRRASKSETRNPSQNTIKSHHNLARRPNKKTYTNSCNGWKSNPHKPHDSATRSLLPGHGRSELPEWSSHLQSNVELGHNPTNHLESQSVEKLEHYAVHKSAETTWGVQNCLRIAENINTEVANTLNVLHHQGEQARRAHEYTLDIDHDLSAGEKLLGSLGGIFSKTWKPMKTRTINGPENFNRSLSFRRRNNHSEQRLSVRPVGKNHTSKFHSDSLAQLQSPCQAKVEIEERKQDEALSDLSNVLSELKRMSLDMGKEISRQTEALDPFQDEVMELRQRVKRANLRGRYLLVR